MWKTLDEKTLKSKKVAELREIAKTFGLQGYEKMKKADLIANLMREEPEETREDETEETTQSDRSHGNHSREDHNRNSRRIIPGSPANPERLVKTGSPTKTVIPGNHAIIGILVKLASPAKTGMTVSKWKASWSWLTMASDSLDSTISLPVKKIFT